MACELVKAYGYDLFPWQRAVLTDWLGRDADDRFAAVSCGLTVPRQNGKNALLESRELYGMVTTGEKFLHTAHEVKTARKAFERLAAFFTDEQRYPELHDMVQIIRRANGQEAITLKNGGKCEFSARTRGAARGFTVDTVVFDEAQELTDEQLEAILPTLAAAPSGNRQFIYAGTPPAPGSPGEVFARTRDVAISGNDPRVAWHEWSVEELPEKGVKWEAVIESVYDTNPTLGYLLDIDFCAQEFNAMSLDGFARERLGWWSGTAAKAAINQKTWRDAAIDADDVPGEGRKAFGVKFAPDGQEVALAVCLLPAGYPDTPAHVELVDVHMLAEGLQWLTSYLCTQHQKQTVSSIAVDGRVGAAALTVELRRFYPPKAVMECTARNATDAASLFQMALNDGALTHWRSDDQALLDESARCVVRRAVGREGAWAYGGEHSAPIEAAALALWAAKSNARNPARKCRIL